MPSPYCPLNQFGVCKLCGKPGKVGKPNLCKKWRREIYRERPGLGDRLESALTKLGITQEKWKAWKDEHGLPWRCHCAERKKWLNEFGETFGKPAAALVRLVLRK